MSSGVEDHCLDHGKRRLNAIVMGFGVTGQGAALFLAARGYKIYILDDVEMRLDVKRACHQYFEQNVFQFLGDQINDIPWHQIEFALVSPGFSMNHSFVERCRCHAVSIYSDLDLFLKFVKVPILAIT